MLLERQAPFFFDQVTKLSFLDNLEDDSICVFAQLAVWGLVMTGEKC